MSFQANDGTTSGVTPPTLTPPTTFGLWGDTQNGDGVIGTSSIGNGVYGRSNSSGIGVILGGGGTSGSGVFGENNQLLGVGVRGVANGSDSFGVLANASGQNGVGVSGNSVSGTGVVGKSENSNGVHGITNSSNTFDSAVYGENTNAGIGVAGVCTNGIGVYGRGAQNAGYFEGNVTVTGDVILTGADCAEEFDIAGVEEVEPGTVMVIDQDGTLQQSQYAYNKRVAGVVSGAGGYRPGIVLDKQQPQDNRIPIALIGKVYCRVDAQYAPIEVGDLLTTSSTPGHAMKVSDPFKAFGSVIGKALRPLEVGQGMIPILIALQ